MLVKSLAHHHCIGYNEGRNGYCEISKTVLTYINLHQGSKVFFPDKPNPPGRPQVTQITTTSMALMWSKPDKISVEDPIIGYGVQTGLASGFCNFQAVPKNVTFLQVDADGLKPQQRL